MSARIGIRKSGIDMMSFKLIFWVLVVPTVLSGSETWVMSAKDKENLMPSQRYSGRRVQRFPFRSCP